ncbi:cytochrome ubiquinol oxidase subunit I [Ostreibacterium oceani]|uniref:Cytochrome ubiquinol oxidase subunit I n=1 Tax=Ostreibacterium oceani TaxID=2654998 RepID=A0A6N7EYY0_9GAMM|nr:cytochrome ubiquinol oxidase subunit I [Ostreibacterium oceani]MPV85688.1 cytochrome ubiquinol oxidase subunit I [Ostreibacterium oceani]
MEFDAFMLSRIQFAANITFHIMFPSVTIAMGWILLFFKLRFNKTGDEAWMHAYFFFTKVFALSFAIGVVSGITMSFQFGTNWPGFMEVVGNIAGPLLAYEVLTAFFLEATFLGIMLFGFRRVPGWLHTTATSLVAIGTTASAFWIIVLNSWMHTPTGFEMIANDTGLMQAHVTNWWEVIFNPSMPYRFIHMLLASGLTACFLIAGLSAYRLLRADPSPAVLKALKTALYSAAVLIVMQIIAGHEHGLNTKQYQPAKLAAMEAVWETERSVPFVLFAIPNEAERRNDFAIEIPYAASLVVTSSLDGEIKGLNEFDVHPPVAPVFFGFRIMVGIGMLMLLVSWIGSYHLTRNKPLKKWFLYILVGMTFAGTIATIAGWYVTEIGRQPWLVEGVLTTADALGPISGGMVFSTLMMYLGVYAFLTVAYIATLFYLAKKAGDGSRRDPEKLVAEGGERHAYSASATTD